MRLPNKDIDKNRETANIGLVSSVGRALHVNPNVAGSNPALVNVLCSSTFFQKMYPVSFPCGLLHDIYRTKSYSVTASSQVVS